MDTTVHTLMRQIIAMEVASDHETYNEGVLGRPNAEYCAWIQQPSSWGGAIEVIKNIYLTLSAPWYSFSEVAGHVGSIQDMLLVSHRTSRLLLTDFCNRPFVF